MAARKRGWFGDPERHAEAGRLSHKGDTKYAWLPLLLLPLFFFIGWKASDYSDSQPSDNNTAGNYRAEYGVGGGPYLTPCPTPNQ